MPLAAPIIIASMIGAGGGIASSVIGSKSAKNAQKAAQNDPLAIAQRQAIEQQSMYGREMGDFARTMMPKYIEGTDYLANYWRSVLDPNNQNALKAISPLVQARKGQTQGLLRNLEFAPRGGGMGERMFDLYGSESRDILNMLSGERTGARTNLAALYGDIGSRATNLYGSAAGTSANAASLLGSMADRSMAAQEAARARAGNTVAGLADALSPLIYSILFKKPSGPASPGKPPIVLPPLPPWEPGG